MYQSRIKNGKSRSNRDEKHRGCIEPEEGQEYAIAQELIGNGRLRALCEDGKVRIARIRGSMRKSSRKVLIDKGDLILVSRRDFEEDKVDVIHKYTHEEATDIANSKKKGLPDAILRAWTNNDIDEDDNVVFMNDSQDDVESL